MKIAVLISGELRTFAQCRSTMKFLDDPRVTVFVSTWRDTHMTNEILQISKSFTRSVDDIKQMLGAIDIGQILVEEHNPFNQSAKYNSPMIYRLMRGISMISEHSNRYDLVIVLRPDLFFKHGTEVINAFTVDGTNMKFLGSHELARGRIQDIMFSGTPEIMQKTINANMLATWNSSGMHDWHKWLFSYFVDITTPQCVDIEVCWGRPNMGITPTYQEVVTAQNVWRDSIVAKQLSSLGKNKTEELWGHECVANVMDLLRNNFFQTYTAMTTAST